MIVFNILSQKHETMDYAPGTTTSGELMRIATTLLILSMLTGCDPYATVLQEDTIDSYEQYLTENPTSPNVIPAKARLEELYYKAAKAEDTLEGYDRYLDRWPKGPHRVKVKAARKDMLWAWAETEHTEAGWQKFLDEYPQAGRKMRGKARSAKKAAAYQGNLAIGDVRVEPVNLAEDPNGPKNGWGFYADITNNGTETIQFLAVSVFYLNAEGKALGTDSWPLVATRFPVPMEEEKSIPVKPGETRTWEWTTGDVPKNWAEKAKIKPMGIRFVDEGARSDGAK